MNPMMMMPGMQQPGADGQAAKPMTAEQQM